MLNDGMPRSSASTGSFSRCHSPSDHDLGRVARACARDPISLVYGPWRCSRVSSTCSSRPGDDRAYERISAMISIAFIRSQARRLRYSKPRPLRLRPFETRRLSARHVSVLRAPLARFVMRILSAAPRRARRMRRLRSEDPQCRPN